MTEQLSNQIADLAVQIGHLTDTVSRLERSVSQQIEETRELRLTVQTQAEVSQTQAENIQSLSASVAQLIALAQQQQATVDRLLATN